MRKEKIQCKEQFLLQYPEYASDDFYIEVYMTTRYNGTFELCLYNVLQPSGKKVYICTYWCQVRQNETGSETYYFEKEEPVDIMKIYVYIDYDANHMVHYRYDRDKFLKKPDEDGYVETDQSAIEDSIIKQFREDNEQKIRQEIANKILSGELKLHFSESDIDGWDVPLSQVDKIYEA